MNTKTILMLAAVAGVALYLMNKKKRPAYSGPTYQTMPRAAIGTEFRRGGDPFSPTYRVTSVGPAIVAPTGNPIWA